MKSFTKIRKRMLSMLLVVVICIPMLTLAAYASHAQNFNFAFSAGVTKSAGNRETLDYDAQVNIESSLFSGGAVKMFVAKTNGTAISLTSSNAIYGNGTYYLYYTDMTTTGNVNLCATIYSGTPRGCSGHWYP